MSKNDKTYRDSSQELAPKHQMSLPPFRNPDDTRLMVFLLQASTRNVYRGLAERAGYFAKMAATLVHRRSVERVAG